MVDESYDKNIVKIWKKKKVSIKIMETMTKIIFVEFNGFQNPNTYNNF